MMATEYCEAPKEVLEMARDLITSYHEELAGVEIAFLMRTPTLRSAGRLVWGKASKANAKQRALSGKDIEFVIELSAEVWGELEYGQRRALLDHELSHCTCEADDDGEIHYKLRPHDLEEFNSIVARYGAWHDGITVFSEQLALFEPLKLCAVGE